jgi:hypothetical protein
MQKEKKNLQLGLDRDEDSRREGLSIRDEFDSDGTSMISRAPDSVMGGVKEPRQYMGEPKEEEMNPADSAYFKKP